MTYPEFIAQHELGIRIGFSLGVFALMAAWELLAPRRLLTTSKFVRWTNNLGLAILNTIILRLLFPFAAVGVAIFATTHDLGVFNHFSVPLPVAILVSLIALDLTIYLQHVLMHAVPTLWRIHRVHHADLDYDVTTGSRFHPVEIIFSMLIKFAAILALGAPALAVVIFEIILNAMSIFNHGNVRLPLGVDRVLRLILVTPDMHRVHHSIRLKEANSNFGFNLSTWDRVFGTIVDQPQGGHDGMSIGIDRYREPRLVSWLPGILALPFLGDVRAPGIKQREDRTIDDQ